jgi:hypothetical protein
MKQANTPPMRRYRSRHASTTSRTRVLPSAIASAVSTSEAVE